MKKILAFLPICFLAVTLTQAQKTSISRQKENNTFNLQLKNDKEKISLTVKGEVILDDDDKNIKKLSPGSSVSYEVKNKSFNITANDNGTITYTINGLQKTNLTDEDRLVVEDCVQLMIDNGIDAHNRVKRIITNKGAEGVLNEVARLKGDYVKEIYLSELLKDKQLSNQEMIDLLEKTGQYLDSDYYKSTLLNGVMTSFLTHEATADAYLKTVAHIKSDYYQYKTLQKLFQEQLSKKQYTQVLSIVSTMKSDYYQSETLKKLLNNTNTSDNDFTSIMKIAGDIKSDYYKAEIINNLLKNTAGNKKRYSLAIEAMQNMKSSYYQADVLTKLIDGNIEEEAEWSRLINYASKIKSDYHQSEVLMKIADKMPGSDVLKKELDEAARNIKSDFYYGKIMRITRI